MKQGHMLDVFEYLYKQHASCSEALSPTSTELKTKLHHAGFSGFEIDCAFNWLANAEIKPWPDLPVAQSDWPIRIYTAEERKVLDTESQGFLLFLEQIGVLTPVIRELVLHRILLHANIPVSVKLLKRVIIYIILTLPGPNEHLTWKNYWISDIAEGYFH